MIRIEIQVPAYKIRIAGQESYALVMFLRKQEIYCRESRNICLCEEHALRTGVVIFAPREFHFRFLSFV